MLKSYKFRIYPNKQQEVLILKTFGCCRFVYNQTLAYRKELYETEKKSMSKFDCSNYCVRVLKPKYPWLREVDKWALSNAVFNMDAAYQKFFREHAGYPKFKNKHKSRKSYTTTWANSNIEINFTSRKIKLPKLRWVKYRGCREFSGQIKSATISQTKSGKFFVSVLVDVEHTQLPKSDSVIGLDLGIKDFCITSDGKKYKNPKVLQQYEKKLARLQRQLAHKQKGSANYQKAKVRLARCHEKIANIRNDYLHKISHEIISENQVIVSEDLNVGGMLRNHKLAKAISDVSWYEFTRQLEYKAQWNGRQYIKIDQFYPSSQLCSVCGYKNTETKDLSVREWQCPSCGAVHDRDVNAAVNILSQGLKQVA